MSATNTVKDGSGTFYWLLCDADGNLKIGGPVAHDAAAAGNPVRIGGVYRSTPPAVANLDIADFLLDAAGRVIVSGAAAHDAAALGNPQRIGGVYRTTPAACSNGDIVDIATDAAGRVYITEHGHTATQVTADGNIKASPGTLYTLIVSGIGVTIGDKVEIKDGGAGGTVKFTVVFSAANETLIVPCQAIAFATNIYAEVTISGGAITVTGVYD